MTGANRAYLVLREPEFEKRSGRDDGPFTAINLELGFGVIGFVGI